MADNTDDEHLDNPINTQSENPPNEITPPTDTETFNLNQETENMEVHKHPHHVTHKKKWGEYFLEFLMLFLAVFLGFIAENIREHNVEHQRAKDYSMSLMEEVAGDTVSLNNSVSYYKSKTENLDTLIQLLSGNIKQVPGGTLYYFSELSLYNSPLIFNKTTLQQLVNSGALRYFTNRKLIKCIGEYDQILQKVENSEASALSILMEARKLQFKIFDFRFKNIYFKGQNINIMNSDSILLIKKTQFPLITYDPAILSEFTGWLNMRSANLKFGNNKSLIDAQNKAIELLALLKKEYHFE